MIDKNGLYMVINENPCQVYLTTRDGGIMFDACSEDNEPVMRQVYFSDILTANSTSGVFKNGTLFFEPEFEEDMYTELRISNWKDILHNKQIEEILLNPTAEQLQMIVGIKQRDLFDRIRGVCIGLVNSGANVPTKVQALINERNNEFMNRKVTTNIVVTPKTADSSEVERLKAMVADLAKKVEEKEPVVEDKPVVTENVTVAPAPAPKKAGRPAKKK